jgi:hypothetical protein
MFYRSDTLLLPLALGQPTQRPQEQPMTVGTVYSTHEALATFTGGEALLRGGKFYRYVTMEGANTVPGVRTLLALQDGSPLLVDKELGRGRVLFFASSADRDWTDLPTRTAYVPLIHGLVGYAAHLSAASQRPGTIMPEATRLLGREEDDGATVTIRTPDGQERLAHYARDDALTVAQYTSYTVPGIYRLARLWSCKRDCALSPWSLRRRTIWGKLPPALPSPRENWRVLSC